MTIGTKLAENALRKIGAHSSAMPALPEDIVGAAEDLLKMLQRWESEGINLGINPLSVPADDLNEPADATLAIEDNLALVLDPDYGSPKSKVSARLKGNANLGYQMMKNIYRDIEVPRKKVSSLTPMGEGQRPWRWGRTFAGNNRRLGN